MYLWMQNLMLHYFVNHRLYDDQHGHRMGRGTLTCWRVILKQVIKAPYIFEFDFMKFHDRIDRAYLGSCLLKFGFPEIFLFFWKRPRRTPEILYK